MSDLQLSSAVHHCLIPTGGLPRNGPLGLHVQLRGTQEVPISPGKSLGLPAISDVESFKSCDENEGYGTFSDIEVYVDTVESPSPQRDTTNKMLNTWL